MPDYRRNRVPGGTYFFTVNLLERKFRLLIDNIDALGASRAQGSRGTTVPYQLLRCIARSHALYLDLTTGRCGFPIPLEGDQNRVCEIDSKNGTVICRASCER